MYTRTTIANAKNILNAINSYEIFFGRISFATVSSLLDSSSVFAGSTKIDLLSFSYLLLLQNFRLWTNKTDILATH